MLHFFDPGEGRDLIARYAAALAPGSYVVLSALTAVPGPDTDKIVRIYNAETGPARVHSLDEIASFFGELEMVPPGVADARVWRPGLGSLPQPQPRGVWTYGGVARKAG